MVSSTDDVTTLDVYLQRNDTHCAVIPERMRSDAPAERPQPPYPRRAPGRRPRDRRGARNAGAHHGGDRKSTRLNSSHVEISYAVFCLKKKKQNKSQTLLLSRISFLL